MKNIYSGYWLHGRKLLATITSIPKDNQADICSDSNYRGTALWSSISKIYDIIFLKRNGTELLTHQLQFAFKENHGTTMCTLLLKDTIQYYVDRQSSVYTCFVDATKAFDMVKFDKLFLLMIKRGVSSIDLRAMMDLYSHQRIRTVWSGTYTGSFSATNGMRHGSVALPILFGLYMDELIQRLESNGDGCWLGPHFYGAMGYADDLSRLCPTAKGLQRMLKVCEIFGEEFGMQFNPKQSVCVHFSRTPNITPRMTLAGKELSWVKRVKHLGNYLCQDLSSQYEIQMKRSDLGRQSKRCNC